MYATYFTAMVENCRCIGRPRFDWNAEVPRCLLDVPAGLLIRDAGWRICLALRQAGECLRTGWLAAGSDFAKLTSIYSIYIRGLGLWQAWHIPRCLRNMYLRGIPLCRSEQMVRQDSALEHLWQLNI